MLPLHSVVLLAGIQGLSEALPVSRSGHDVVAWTWLELGASGARLEVLLHAATGSALLFGARRWLVAATGAGLRAIARPVLFQSSAAARDAAVLVVALVTSLCVRALIEPWVSPWKNTSTATGFGLLLTGLLVGTTTLVDVDRNTQPTLPFAVVFGVGHAMGAFPGGSDIGAALVLCAWMGTKNEWALDFALALSGAALLVGCLFSLPDAANWPDLSIPVLLMGLLTAFLGATVAIGATRVLLEKRALAMAALWIIPLGFATLAYSRGLSEGLTLATTTCVR